MGQYIIRRVLQAIPLLIIVTVLVFFLLKAAGDPFAYLAQDPRVTERDRAVLRAKYGLDDPLPLQFVHWLVGDDWYLRVTSIRYESPANENTLFKMNEERQPVPNLLKEYTVSDDGLTYTFVVDQAILHQDTTPIRAVDVAYTLTKVAETTPRLINSGDPFTVNVVDATTLTVTLAAANENFITPLTNRQTALIKDGGSISDVVKRVETISQYGIRKGIVRGDFGDSLRFQRPVTDVIASRIGPTLTLMGTSFLIELVFGLAIGMYAALHQYSIADNVMTAISFILFSMPVFLTALILVHIFAVTLGILPTSGMYDVRGDRSFDELLRHLILPVTALATINVAGYSRFIRSTMLEVINSEYIRTARAKGLAERRVTYLHALKNASLPLVTLVGLNIPFLLSGAVITETIFSWPGMGFMFINALEFLDAPLLVAFVLMTAVAVVFMQLVTDIVYSWLDPRIRYG